MRSIALPLLACLGACANMTTSQQTQVNQALAVACDVDGVLVPIAQPVVAALGPSGTTAADVDSLLVHPAVVAACAAIQGTPASVTPVGAPTTTPASPAASPTN